MIVYTQLICSKRVSFDRIRAMKSVVKICLISMLISSCLMARSFAVDQSFKESLKGVSLEYVKEFTESMKQKIEDNINENGFFEYVPWGISNGMSYVILGASASKYNFSDLSDVSGMLGATLKVMYHVSADIGVGVQLDAFQGNSSAYLSGIYKTYTLWANSQMLVLNWRPLIEHGYIMDVDLGLGITQLKYHLEQSTELSAYNEKWRESEYGLSGLVALNIAYRWWPWLTVGGHLGYQGLLGFNMKRADSIDSGTILNLSGWTISGYVGFNL
jgi:hypothetical protein